MKRYGPLIAIVVVIAIVVAVVAQSRGGGGDDATTRQARHQRSERRPPGGPVDDQRREPGLDRLGPELRHQARHGEDPVHLRGAVREAVQRRQRRRDRRRRDRATRSRSSCTSATRRRTRCRPRRVKGAGADVEPGDREGDVPGLRRPVREVLRDSTAARSTSQFFDGTGGPTDEVAARADAKAIADMHPFAVLTGPTRRRSGPTSWPPTTSCASATARSPCPRRLVEEHSPYLCGDGPTPEQAGQLTAKLVTKLLKGKKAELRRRRAEEQDSACSASSHYDTIDGQQTAAFAKLKSALTDGRREDRGRPAVPARPREGQENARTMIAKLKDAGVTTRHLHR